MNVADGKVLDDLARTNLPIAQPCDANTQKFIEVEKRKRPRQTAKVRKPQVK